MFVISSQRKANSVSLLAIHAQIYGLNMIFPNIFCETNNFLRTRFASSVTFSTSDCRSDAKGDSKKFNTEDFLNLSQKKSCCNRKVNKLVKS